MRTSTIQMFKAATVVSRVKPTKQAGPDWLRIENKGSEATIFIYGEITPYPWFESDVSAASVLDELDEIDASVIHVRINSSGGSVFDGVAIYNLLREHPSKIIIHIDAMAASIASVIAMAGDEIRISEAASMMIHDPFVATAGDAAELRKVADMLEVIKEQIISVYHRKTGISVKELSALMADETWMNGAKAVELGFADFVAEESPAESGLGPDGEEGDEGEDEDEDREGEDEPPERKRESISAFNGVLSPPIRLRVAQAAALEINHKLQP